MKDASNEHQTRRIYFADAYRTEFEARVLKRLDFEGKPALVLDETCFYPESGGQPWDRGTLEGIDVIKVVEDNEGRIVHVLARDIAGERVKGRIDWTTRFDHMQQHSGQHILSQAFFELLRGETRSFHLGDDVSTLEIGVARIADEDVERVERRANAVVFEDREIKTYFVPEERIGEIPLRRPPKKEGLIRVVEVGGYDYSACGGTHCWKSGEIGPIKILKWERIRGNLRFEFVCGGRALRDYQMKNRVVRSLAGTFNVQDRDVPAAVDRLSSELKNAKKDIRRLEELAASYEAKEIAAAVRGPVFQNVYRDRSLEAVRLLALNLARQADIVVLFGAVTESRSHVVMARPDKSTFDLRELVPIVSPLINGRGGGSPSLVEIAGDRGADLSSALEKAAASVRRALA
jgi:alanyl-tRNA synthetase